MELTTGHGCDPRNSRSRREIVVTIGAWQEAWKRYLRLRNPTANTFTILPAHALLLVQIANREDVASRVPTGRNLRERGTAPICIVMGIPVFTWSTESP